MGQIPGTLLSDVYGKSVRASSVSYADKLQTSHLNFVSSPHVYITLHFFTVDILAFSTLPCRSLFP